MPDLRTHLHTAISWLQHFDNLFHISFRIAVQHERAPRSISKGKSLLASTRSSLGSSRERGKKLFSKVKCEGSETNSSYSSQISPEQWNELESSTENVFLNFDSSTKKSDEEPELICNDDNINVDSKLIGENKNDDLELFDKNNAILQCLVEGTAKNSENLQISNSSINGESSTHYDENDDKNSNENPNEVNEANMPLINASNLGEQSAQANMFPFSLYDSSIQLLYMSVSWARNIPMFMDLPFRDQAILLEEAWSELFLLNAVYFFLPVDMTTLFQATSLPLHQSANSNLIKEIRTLQNVVARFHQLHMSAVEYACLKAVVLFKPGT